MGLHTMNGYSALILLFDSIHVMSERADLPPLSYNEQTISLFKYII